MASLTQKDGIYLIRFRYGGKAYKRSLQTGNPEEATNAWHLVQGTLGRLAKHHLQVPSGVDPGDYIASGGILSSQHLLTSAVTPVAPLPTMAEAPPAVTAPTPVPPVTKLCEEYLVSLENKIAPTYLATQKTHLKNLGSFLGRRADEPCDRVTRDNLEKYIQQRRKSREDNTVCRERVTLRLFFAWTVRKEFLAVSPAAELEPIQEGAELPKFLTTDQIEASLQRGGLTDDEALAIWKRLYLRPAEIAGILAVVRTNAVHNISLLLHAIPAYTGMRRGEVVKLKWSDVDFEADKITARSRKQSRSRKVTNRDIDLHPELRAELLAWRERFPRGQFIICDTTSLEPLTVDRANTAFWQPLRGTSWCLDRKRNRFKLGFHTYRHSFCSNLAAAGVDQRIIDEYVGHNSDAMRRRYRHLFPANLKRAIRTFSLAADPVGVAT